MTERAVSVAFFDRAHGISGTVRAGVALLFEGKTPRTLPEDPQLDFVGDRLRAGLGDAGSLEFESLSEGAALAGATTRLCRVTGTVSGQKIRCLGTLTETLSAPTWSELDALRSISAVFDEQNAVFVVALRPRGARGHGAEAVEAKLLLGGALVEAEEARVSTVYDAEGRQRTAGLELWLADEDFPRRVSGSVEAGASLALDGLRVNAAVFGWRMEGREGAGAYELAVRERMEVA